ncbi:helix-turn-helix domain-containing protein [Roseateles sp. DAIF2]|uniref:helix-turn-helix domain-containing protein n=1 Tax=Roseateles sp. DAIF2 TaxID=2714952 RepID=UPI0018A2E475|nr:helix-turn-helix domain-containing protein [Roseateles sp. DAIF2]QPF72942.1 helix-turn-helix domain-containing protein [Roseateles sp. DAIF2]
MDSLIAAAARALAGGDALAALQRVALREDPPALALRGIAMAQLGEFPRARELLRRAARGFGAREPVARARCIVAEAEVALALRELGGSSRNLDAAAALLEAQGDIANARLAQLIALRRWLLLGRLETAAALLPQLEPLQTLPPALQAVARLAAAELALRALDIAPARAALEQASLAAERAQVPALQAEVAEALALLERPAARCRDGDGIERPLRLHEVEALRRAPDLLLLDACRHGLRRGDGRWLRLARRPVLFALAEALAEAWPGDAAREALIERAFRTHDPDETHRARLRVEIGRLRALIAPLARVEASTRGFALLPRDGRRVALLRPPLAGESAALQALLADGAAWSSSALALALGSSQRQVQRELAELQAADRVRAIGRGRTQRWLAPSLTGFTTILLLPAALPSG